MFKNDYFKLRDREKWFTATSPMIFLLFVAKGQDEGDVTLAEQSECVLTTHILVHSCQSLRNYSAVDMATLYKTGAQ
jgi:hypothetical protein